jgi:hypothetical protein
MLRDHLSEDHADVSEPMTLALQGHKSVAIHFAASAVSQWKKVYVEAWADNALPPYVFQSASFIRFMEYYRHNKTATLPGYRIFNNSLKEYSSDLAESCSSRMLNALAVSISFDIWSKMRESFIGVRAHIITAEFERATFCLGVESFNNRHTAENIAVKVLSILQCHQLTPQNVFGMTHDSASNNTAKAFVAKTSWAVKISCIAHLASNTTKHFFKRVPSALEMLGIAKRITKLFRKSTIAAQLLLAEQQGLHQKPRALPAQSETRFNGGYIILEALVREQQPLLKALTQLQLTSPQTYKLVDKHHILDWQLLQQLVAVLKPVHHFIVIMQSREILLSDVIFQVLELQRNIKAINSKIALENSQGKGVEQPLNSFCVPMLSSLKESFDMIYHVDANAVSAFVICCALDPRGKLLRFLGAPQSTEAEEKRKTVWKKIEANMQVVLTSLNDDDKITSAPATHVDESGMVEDDDIYGTPQASTSHESSVKNFSQVIDWQSTLFLSIHVYQKIHEQLEAFQRKHTIAPDSDPCVWWALKDQDDIPLVRAYAAKWFSVQPTEVEVERDFFHSGEHSLPCTASSTHFPNLGRTYTKTRNRTKPKRVSQYAIVKHNAASLREDRAAAAMKRDVAKSEEAKRSRKASDLAEEEVNDEVTEADDEDEGDIVEPTTADLVDDGSDLESDPESPIPVEIEETDPLPQFSLRFTTTILPQ